jgi:hypothetical protein
MEEEEKRNPHFTNINAHGHSPQTWPGWISPPKGKQRGRRQRKFSRLENRKQNKEKQPNPDSPNSYAHGHRTTNVVLAEFAAWEGSNVGNAVE